MNELPWIAAQFAILALTVGCAPWHFALAVAWSMFPASLWASIVQSTDEWTLLAFGPSIIAIVTYWVNGLLWLVLNIYNQPAILQQFKIQSGKGFDTNKIASVVKNLLIGQFLVMIPAVMLIATVNPLLLSYGMGVKVTPELPSSASITWGLLALVVTDEVLFFYSHWALHQPGVYSRIHRVHHEFTSPIALVAAYSHPLEMLISNVLPLGLGAMFAGSHVFTLLMWSMFAVVGTQFHHSGYRFPWTPWFDHQPNFHDYHHKYFYTNMGLMGWFDGFHGTDKKWRQHLAHVGTSWGVPNFRRMGD
eukprot:NODE_2035_length_1153_cov_68.011696_g2018_i0.p1 GENE.NODE_2035_length_1153_cov_68.011696_g2018_i0~~NODE_2035_length_1153_cov_68.011696_g2018_i0.p1  ORF type:complete len:305 (-),score=36.29 NODE_2035_length_1153_cov_68.011696_g2018_i0:166-1080(-)